MSVEHKRPLLAFFMVAVLCGVVVGHTLATQAVPAVLKRPVAAVQRTVEGAAFSVAASAAQHIVRPAAPFQPVSAAPSAVAPTQQGPVALPTGASAVQRPAVQHQRHAGHQAGRVAVSGSRQPSAAKHGHGKHQGKKNHGKHQGWHHGKVAHGPR